MGKIRRTFSIDFKMKAIELYSHRGIGSNLLGKELGVTYSVIDRWIKKYENEGILGLQEKRGRSKQTNEVSQDARIQRLEAENEYLKKLLATKKEMRSTKVNQ
ncbi:helix-turn-helix domain-containing protein [Bacillus thuringiensis]|uniref:helix-turn-helix domain-containing protein n=1 Tax=Bacillus cereus group TaxID=86661 RepID=UPI0028539C8A|nr:helix-turn-helix domain-containing protein [Bacillus thuringiensis]MDR5045278.1 helix-turn-helix domain-containing protein [Bacillus thuringiensis]MEB9420760.1 helix-turn-helix domain-containing protein [Bacillus cereus]